MNAVIKICSLCFFFLVLLTGCVSQSGQNSNSRDFDQLKASKTRVSLGLTYLKSGNFSQAKFNLDKALEFAPRSADANFAMAYYYQNVDELEQAEALYQFAMDLEPKNADIANSYGAFLCQIGDYKKAKKYFLKAVNSTNYVSSAQTYENLALCSQSQGRPDDAIQYFRNAVNHQPGRANSLYLLAEALVDTGQWLEAKDIFRRYEKVSQVSPQSLLMSVKIEKGMGNLARAKGYADMLKILFPNSAENRSLVEPALPVQIRQLIVAKKITKILKPTKKPDIITQSTVAKTPLIAPVNKEVKNLVGPAVIAEDLANMTEDIKPTKQPDVITHSPGTKSPLIASVDKEVKDLVEPAVIVEDLANVTEDIKPTKQPDVITQSPGTKTPLIASVDIEVKDLVEPAVIVEDLSDVIEDLESTKQPDIITQNPVAKTPLIVSVDKEVEDSVEPVVIVENLVNVTEDLEPTKQPDIITQSPFAKTSLIVSVDKEVEDSVEPVVIVENLVNVTEDLEPTKQPDIITQRPVAKTPLIVSGDREVEDLVEPVIMLEDWPNVTGSLEPLVTLENNAANTFENLGLEKPTEHTVSKGENLYRISLLYNIDTELLIQWNQLDDVTALSIGMVLSLVAPNSAE
jgi:type IV pilus assembly protein PilF